MREVGEDGAVEREGQRVVVLGVVDDGQIGEAGEEFVDITYALDWPEGIAVPRTNTV